MRTLLLRKRRLVLIEAVYMVSWLVVVTIAMPHMCRNLAYSYYYQPSEIYPDAINKLSNENAERITAAKEILNRNNYRFLYNRLNATNVDLCIVVLTAIRPTNPQYLTQTVASITRQLNDIKHSYTFTVYNVDGEGHSEAYHLAKYVPVVHNHTIRTLMGKGPFEKQRIGYAAGMRWCLSRNARFNIVIEDDAFVESGFFSNLRFILNQCVADKVGVKWGMMKLYYPEKYQGWGNYPTNIVELLMFTTMIAFTITICSAFFCIGPMVIDFKSCKINIKRPLMSFRLLFTHACVLFVLLSFGRAHWEELRKVNPLLISVSEAKGCCTPAVLYPRPHYKDMIEYMESKAMGPATPYDLVLDQFVELKGLNKLLAVPNMSEFKGDLYSLPDIKWHWRMRVSALHFASVIPTNHSYKVLFASSVLNLCELVGLRPDLNGLTKVIYFHENQLVYPVRKQKERDFQYGYIQILSCLAADRVLFNSHYNMDSFLGSINSFMKLSPDYRPGQCHNITETIRGKATVVYYPVDVPPPYMYEVPIDDGVSVSTDGSPPSNTPMTAAGGCEQQRTAPLHIVWPHRWEHDKCPDMLYSVMKQLKEAGLQYKLSILGSHTNDIPDCMKDIPSLLHDDLVHYGPVPKEDYWKILSGADVVLSTAKHEFFGVAMLEATLCGCYPLCPNSLVYPELYPAKCLFNTEQQLFKKLKNLCQKPYLAKHYRNSIDTKSLEQYSWDTLRKEYNKIIIVEK